MGKRLRIAVDGKNPPLALEFHPRGAAVYLRLSDETAARTVEVEAGVLADYDDCGDLVGFELLDLEGPGVVGALARLKNRFAAAAPQLLSVEAIAG